MANYKYLHPDFAQEFLNDRVTDWQHSNIWREHPLFTCEQFHPRQTHHEYFESGTKQGAFERRFDIRLQEARQAAERASWIHVIWLCDEELLSYDPFNDAAFDLLTDALKAQRGLDVRAAYNLNLFRENTDGSRLWFAGLSLISLILLAVWFVRPETGLSISEGAANTSGILGLLFGLLAFYARPTAQAKPPHWIWSRFPEWRFSRSLHLETHFSEDD